MFTWQLRRPIHTSWLVAVLCLGICVGIFVISIVSAPVSSFLWLIIALTLSVFSFWKGKMYTIPILLVAGGIFGLWRANQYQGEISPYKSLVGQTIKVKGRVAEDTDTGRRGDMVLRLEDISVAGHPLEGRIWVSSSEAAEVKRSDLVTVEGEMNEGFGSFAASMYRAEIVKIERKVPGDVALTVRDRFANGVRQSISEPEASLGVGYLVGQRRSLPENLDTALQAAGLTHIVVASGYNLTILVGASRRLLAKVSKFLATFVSGGMILGFIAVTGMSPSMSRAGLVTAMGLLAWHYGRRFHPLVLLPLAAAITLLVNPSYGQNDLGWQLSFASFAGVLIVAPLLQSYFFGPSPPGVIRQVLFETISAWVCTVPLIVLVFGQFSNVAIIANVLILPLVPLAMILTFIAGSITLVVPAFAVVAGLPATLVLGYMTGVALYLGNVSWAQTTLSMNAYTLVIFYVILVSFCWYIWRKTRFNFVETAMEE